MKYKKIKYLLIYLFCWYILLINYGIYLWVYLICLIIKKVKISFVEKENRER